MVTQIVPIDCQSHSEILYQMAMIVEVLRVWSPIVIPTSLLEHPTHVAPSVPEEDISPSLGDAKATCEVIVRKMRGDNV
jgi:hypothetical protein